MSANVIQHTRPRRKRAHARSSWTARHLVLLVVVIGAIIAASWLAPDMVAAPAPAPASAPQHTAAPVFPPVAPDVAVIDAAADLAGPPIASRRVRQSARQTGIPLNAAVPPRDDYEILSAAELDGISQARN
jgi:pyruvate/2-oxoglutarate dehydrogenase complex dihydrolipoamide acyltransferase (E2) component